MGRVYRVGLVGEVVDSNRQELGTTTWGVGSMVAKTLVTADELAALEDDGYRY